jgi:L-rhamnose isomerase/sugar isomerase
MKEEQAGSVWKALDSFRIELPSWGFANTGTRFGKFMQPAAAQTLEDKLSDAGEVNKLTGVCPTVALHVLWDLPNGLGDVSNVQKLSERYGVRPGSINPNLFQSQEYKHGSVTNPDPKIRLSAQQHILDCVEIAKQLSSRDVAPWFADGSNYPGTQNIRHRIAWLEDAVKKAHDKLGPEQRLLIEYKPF